MRLPCTLNEIIQHIEQYLEKIAIPEHPALKQKFLSLLQVMVYVRVLEAVFINQNTIIN